MHCCCGLFNYIHKIPFFTCTFHLYRGREWNLVHCITLEQRLLIEGKLPQTRSSDLKISRCTTQTATTRTFVLEYRHGYQDYEVWKIDRQSPLSHTLKHSVRSSSVNLRDGNSYGVSNYRVREVFCWTSTSYAYVLPARWNTPLTVSFYFLKIQSANKEHMSSSTLEPYDAHKCEADNDDISSSEVTASSPEDVSVSLKESHISSLPEN